MIKVFFDTSPLKQGHAVRGIGNYTKNLRTELEKSNEIKLVESEKEADIIHYPYFDIFFNTLKVSNKPVVVTIYDTIPLIYPKQYPPGIKGKINFFKQKNKLKKVDAIITISETSKKDIVRFLGVDEKIVYPIYLAPASHFRKLAEGSWKNDIIHKYNLPKEYVLYVGDVNYNKNLISLVSACVALKKHLVIVGRQAASVDFDKSHIENSQLLKLIEKYGNNEFVHRLGFVEDEDLVRIYNLATVYCQPSFYEGFGLPILEAMACDTPVVATKIQSTYEIVEDSCLYTKSFDSKSISASLKILLSDDKKRNEYAKLGQDVVEKYSWKKTTQMTERLYESLV